MLHESGPRRSRWWNFEILGVKHVVDFWWQIFSQFSPGKIGLTFVTENCTTFFTERKNFVTWNSLWEHPRLTYVARDYFRNKGIELNSFYMSGRDWFLPRGWWLSVLTCLNLSLYIYIYISLSLFLSPSLSLSLFSFGSPRPAKNATSKAFSDWMQELFLGSHILGRAKGDVPKVTEPHLQFPAVFCENLRFPAKVCGFLRFPAPWNFQEKGCICENLRFSAKICVLGSLSLSVTLVLSPQGRPDILYTPAAETTFLGAGGRALKEGMHKQGRRLKFLSWAGSKNTPRGGWGCCSNFLSGMSPSIFRRPILGNSKWTSFWQITANLTTICRQFQYQVPRNFYGQCEWFCLLFLENHMDQKGRTQFLKIPSSWYRYEDLIDNKLTDLSLPWKISLVTRSAWTP